MSSAAQSPPRRTLKRSHIACESCRRKRAKCVLDSDRPLERPCARCRRELRECIFTIDGKRSSTRIPPKRADAEGPHAFDQIERSDSAPQSGKPLRQPSRAQSHIDELRASETPYRQDSEAVESGETTATQDGLADPLVRTVVSNGSEALNLLLQATSHNDHVDKDHRRISIPTHPSWNSETPASITASRPNLTRMNSCEISEASENELNVWRRSRFVNAGWFSAEEALTYVDLFFKNMAPLTPAITDYFSKRENHHLLTTKEPLLCGTILMISSRYHILPGIGGVSRGHHIHHHLWEFCQHLIMKIMFGQMGRPGDNVRTIGSIEALLLITDWHPRDMHFPSGKDSWDSDLSMASFEGRKDSKRNTRVPSWLSDIVSSVKLSDRMSWMLLGCALSLGHELNLYDTEELPEMQLGTGPRQLSRQRQLRVKRMLFITVEQLSSRLGYTSAIPHALGNLISTQMNLNEHDEGQLFLKAWIELTKLATSSAASLFPSPAITRQLLLSGRYINLINHFQPLLTHWQKKYLDSHRFGKAFQAILQIEYQYTKIFVNSLGMQAIIDRALAQAGPEGVQGETLRMAITAVDYEFTQESIDGSCQILLTIIELAKSGVLRYASVRTFQRTIAASIYLIKGLSLGTWTEKLQNAFSILERVIEALRSSPLDDLHLASRYAMLLEMHVAGLQGRFVLSSIPEGIPSRAHSEDMTYGLTQEFSDPISHDDRFAMSSSAGDWLSLPIDPVIASMTANADLTDLQDAELGSWNLLFNLSTG